MGRLGQGSLRNETATRGVNKGIEGDFQIWHNFYADLNGIQEQGYAQIREEMKRVSRDVERVRADGMGLTADGDQSGEREAIPGQGSENS